MKDVLISIQPKWVAKICNEIYKRADGTPVYEKEIEVRKTRPKLETPFKCFIYCTKAKEDKYILERLEDGVFTRLDGKVIGEFICDKIDKFRCCSVPYQKENNLGYGHFVDNGVYKVNGWFEGIVFERNDRYIDSMLKNNDLKEMCLSAQEIFDYIGMGKHLYAWHISNLKIYGKPKELSEFLIDCKNCNKKFVGDTNCWQGCVNGYRRLTRPPQSWCYVEEL